MAFLLAVIFALCLSTVIEGHAYGYHKPKSIKCYQCAYSKDEVTVEQIQVPRVVYEDIQVPRTVIEDVEVTTVVDEEITVTRTEFEEVQVPRIVKKEVSVPRVVHTVDYVPTVVHDHVEPVKSVKSVKSVGYGHTVPRVVYSPVTITSLVHDTKIVEETVYDTELVSKIVEETKTVPKTVVEVIQESKIVYDTETVSKTVYDTKNITKTVQGGWQKCLSAFTPAEATAHGIDVWDCHDNCYTRIDNNGENLYRGCYKGEFGVDPNKIGCHEQTGAQWCFCEGDLCNNGAH